MTESYRVLRSAEMRFFFWCGVEHFISELLYKGKKNILFYERAKKQMIFKNADKSITNFKQNMAYDSNY